MKVFFVLLISFLATHRASAQDFVIDFEQIPNEINREGLRVGTQYLAELGIEFKLEDGRRTSLARVGPPAAAFGGNWGADTPAPNQNIGSYFLTDDGDLQGLNAPPLIIESVNPLKKLGGVILDIDFDERYVVEALDSLGNVMQTTRINDGDPNTGDGLATRWEIEVDGCEGFYSVRIEGSRDQTGAFGLGADNIEFYLMSEFVFDNVFIEALHINCNRMMGSIIVDNDRTEELMYSIDGINFQSDNVFNNLEVGNYIVSILNEDNCLEERPIFIEENSPIELFLSENPTRCGLDNGTITASVLNGREPLEFSIDGSIFQPDSIFNNLAPGDYSVVVVDADGCEDSAMVSIEDSRELLLEAIVTGTKCGLNNGSITLSVSDGMEVIRYSIDELTFQTEELFEGLSAGQYIATAIDANGCEAVRQIVIESSVGATALFNITPQCGEKHGAVSFVGSKGEEPLQYSLDGISFQSDSIFLDVPAGEYSLTVLDANGCQDEQNITVNANEAPDLQSMIVPQCDMENGSIVLSTLTGTGPYQYSIDGISFQLTGIFDNVPVGEYTATVIDENGCEDDLLVELNSHESPVVDHILSTATTCGKNNGTIEINANGGTGNLTYALNDQPMQEEGNYTNLQAGTYTIEITDEAGCTAQGLAQVDTSVSLHVTDIVVTLPDCDESNGSIEVEANSNEINVTINQRSIAPELKVNNIRPGEYEIYIMDDNGCEDDTTIMVGQGRCPFFIPSAFSPNDDGVNDVFNVFPHPDFAGTFSTLNIYDRWGATVFQDLDYKPSTSGWNGMVHNQEAQVGVYVYVLEVLYHDGESQVLKGDVTLVK